MSHKISFCINTTKFELEYLKLLFRSLSKNLYKKDHEILIFVENDTSDNDVVKFLLSQKSIFSDLKIIKNPLPIPIGYARNINILFNMAKYDRVSYIQSDMLVCQDYDIEVCRYLTPNIILSSTRIEPPLHPPSPEKITKDFGLDPKTINLNEFTTYSNTVKQCKLTDYFFAPFTLYKQLWNDMGGHDTLFRRSREDSDIIYRLGIAGIKTKQCWNANVYHFTCTSSRGVEWWKQENKQKTDLQQMADYVEMTRFLRKWPGFKHSSTFDPDKEYKYQISANILNSNLSDVISILNGYYRFHHIYIKNPEVRSEVKKEYNNLHSYANKTLNISNEQWNQYKKYYRTLEADDIFVDNLITNEDVIIDIPNANINFNDTLNKMNDIVHENKDETGTFECEGLQITINRVINRIKDNIKVINPSINDIKFEII